MSRQKRFTHVNTVRISVELKEKIREAARVRGVSMAQIMREAIEEKLRVLERDDDTSALLRERLRQSREF